MGQNKQFNVVVRSLLSGPLMRLLLTLSIQLVIKGFWFFRVCLIEFPFLFCCAHAYLEHATYNPNDLSRSMPHVGHFGN